MLEDLQVRNLSVHTQRSYLEQVSRFARHFDKSPAELGPEEIRAYQVYLTNEKKLAPASIVIAVSALRFLYKVTLQREWSIDEVIPAPKKPQTLPVVLSPEEVVQFLECVKQPKHRTILTTCYAAGLRISEAVRLTIPAIDSQRMVLRVTLGKGQKDRDLMLSPKLLDMLREWWKLTRPTHWLFPGNRPGHPITRHAVERVCQDVHRRCRIPKPITPHSLRQHAGSRIMPGSRGSRPFRACTAHIWFLPSRHNPDVFFRTACWPGMEETCWITSSRIATRVRECGRGSLARTSIRSPHISPRAGTPPRRFDHSYGYSRTSASG